MRHVFTRIGDSLTQEEVTNFINILDNQNDGYIRLQDVVNLFLPQTHKDVYAKSVGAADNGAERSHQSYGAAQIGASGVPKRASGF